MIRCKNISILVLLFFCNSDILFAQQSFVTTSNGQFISEGKPYYYIGVNYWYSGLVANDNIGKERIKKELDFLKSKGVDNLRIMAGAEGYGQINGVPRVEPAFQPKPGVFNKKLLLGLDFLLAEMGKRKMKAIIFLSNNWEWSGGFLQYLNWNGLMPDSVLQRKLSWDEMRDYVSQFYSCKNCIKQYKKQVKIIINRVNTITKKTYKTDPAIMSWEIANEPRPMRSTAIEKYKKFISKAASYIKKLDKHHLITIGSEGEMGSENIDVFTAIHADVNINYTTIHIWPKNWGWFKDTSIVNSFNDVVSKTSDYILKHAAVSKQLGKPLVIEEFGLPRDNHSFSIAAPTVYRDKYFTSIFDKLLTHAENNGVIAGANIWTFSGSGRPSYKQLLWKKGDDVLGDPPVEEQGLNSVFDCDKSTWDIITNYTLKFGKNKMKKYIYNTTAIICCFIFLLSCNANAQKEFPSDKQATKETVNLYNNLKRLAEKGFMFGHQDDLAYGVEWKYKEGRSDIKDVAGDYPAVYGWDLGGLERDNSEQNLDGVPFKKMKQFIKQGYQRGGVITISWHLDSPLGNYKNAWDTTHGTVASINPGGVNHTLYKEWLDKVAAFISSLKGSKGEAIPVLFRPYHEHTGSWFWWGKNECTAFEYKTLWRFTVYYLQNEKKLNNLLWVFNTGGDFNTTDEFLERYPGDDMVDMLSFDTYQFGDPQKEKWFEVNTNKRLKLVGELAKEKNKLFALAETGYEAVPYANWWTENLMTAIGDNKISYVLVWRNHGYQESSKKMHYYAPYKGQVSATDFIKFYQLEKTLFEKDVFSEKLYD